MTTISHFLNNAVLIFPLTSISISISISTTRERTMAPKIGPGQIVRIHSLQSESGQKLNGKRGIVIRKVVDPNGGPVRFEIKVEKVTPSKATSALKPANLTVEEPLPLPEEGGKPRGRVVIPPMYDEIFRDLAELLLMKTEEYLPPKAMLVGLPAMAMGQLGQMNYGCFTAVQVRHGQNNRSAFYQ
jgi:hypothetical protein